jgi:hypothetical protein
MTAPPVFAIFLFQFAGFFFSRLACREKSVWTGRAGRSAFGRDSMVQARMGPGIAVPLLSAFSITIPAVHNSAANENHGVLHAAVQQT